ncbi:MAG TPA: choice-of-anchor B family protein [Thermoanaerobaculia bacterium]|nr:choice-of-anchor B family protein [Thermoanaerobaculia bacterium]
MSRMRLGGLFCVVCLVVACLAVTPGLSAGPQKHEGEEPGDPTISSAPPALGATPCRNGHADVYPCKNIDLESFMPLEDLGADPDEKAAGIWGWTDPRTRHEYALIALRNRVSFVDVTDAKHPRLVGYLPGRALDTTNREVNVYGDFAFVVADARDGNGLQVFDLTQLRGVTNPPIRFGTSADLIAGDGRIHNLNVNQETGFAYEVGGAECGGGLRMIDVHDPFSPVQVACWADPSHSYIHDTQCVVYRGPDKRFKGHEICFASAVDALLIVDVTDKSAPLKISRTSYPGAGYTHQGWLTGNQKFFLMDDEFDELAEGHPTRTYLWNFASLTAPRQFATYDAPTEATDHNQYVRGNLVYQSNYRAGLRILNISKIAAGKLREVGYFDIVPDSDEAGYEGAWGNYPFFPSGTVVVSGISQGLYILKPMKRVR